MIRRDLDSISCAHILFKERSRTVQIDSSSDFERFIQFVSKFYTRIFQFWILSSTFGRYFRPNWDHWRKWCRYLFMVNNIWKSWNTIKLFVCINLTHNGDIVRLIHIWIMSKNFKLLFFIIIFENIVSCIISNEHLFFWIESFHLV